MEMSVGITHIKLSWSSYGGDSLVITQVIGVIPTPHEAIRTVVEVKCPSLRDGYKALTIRTTFFLCRAGGFLHLAEIFLSRAGCFLYAAEILLGLFKLNHRFLAENSKYREEKKD